MNTVRTWSRVALLALALLAGWAVGVARADDAKPAPTDADIARGHHLAALICSACHLAARDQIGLPLMNPPAPPFDALAQRKDLDAPTIGNFLRTTHRDVLTRKGMPDLSLTDDEIAPLTAYILSLRKAH